MVHRRVALTIFASRQAILWALVAFGIYVAPFPLSAQDYTLEQAKREMEESLKDPAKVKILECMGIQIYKDPQPPGHPPSREECAKVERSIGYPLRSDEPESYRYACKFHGQTSTLKVDEKNNTLTWLGNTYRIKQTECAKYGWHAERDGMSFDFCTATQGYASFDLPTGMVECSMQRR